MMFIINAYRYLVNLIHTTFDGTNEYISVSHDASIDFDKSDACSFSFWINANNIPTGTPTQLLDKRDNSNNGYNINFFNNEIIISFLGNSSANRKSANFTFSSSNTGSWYHILFTIDATTNASGLKCYVNGSSVSSNSTVNSLTLTTLTTANLYIGANRFNSQNFNGKMDKVKIFNKELTSGEVTTIYNYGRKAGLIGIGNEVSQWELDALNPTDVIGSNDGTSTNMDSSNIVIG